MVTIKECLAIDKSVSVYEATDYSHLPGVKTVG